MRFALCYLPHARCRFRAGFRHYRIHGLRFQAISGTSLTRYVLKPHSDDTIVTNFAKSRGQIYP